MIEKIKYINHMNEVIDFGRDGIYVNENELHDFQWEVTTKNKKISSLNKDVTDKSLPVQISCRSKEAGISARNKLFEVCEKDVLAMKSGKLVIGDYYLECYVTKFKASNYLKNKRMLEAELTITTDHPFWIKETRVYFDGVSGETSDYLDYPYDYPYDFKPDLNSNYINNTDFTASNFRINIYGFVANPQIFINSHEYSVDVTIDTGEFLTINSIDKTIILTKLTGEKINCFDDRNKDSYIFEKIQSGRNPVSTSGAYKFEIILIEERSIPKWT